MTAPVSIALEQATAQLGKTRALSEFSGSFAPGTVSAVIGGDGAGKTTLLRALAGRVPLNASRTVGLPVDSSNIGYLPAHSGVWRNLSVAENIEFVSRAFQLPSEEARRRAATLLARAGLSDVTARLAGRLSGGMRQKLGVVLATLHAPGLVLLDEPTTGVDPISRAEIWSLIADAAAEGATVVFATTYLDEAERAAQLFLLGAGSLLASGRPDSVIAQTPGRIWQAAMSQRAARAAVADPRGWRRGNTVYLWDPAPDAAAPPGFHAAPGDLENTSIALLTAATADGSLPTGANPQASGRSTPPADATPRQGAAAHRAPARSAPVRRAPLVEASAVLRTYGGFTALDGVSLSVAPGEVVGLLGGNGAGKTTLMRVLLGLETANGGSVELLGGPPSLAKRRRIGYVAQGIGLYPTLSARENLEFAAAVHRVPVRGEHRAFAAGLGSGPTAALSLGAQRTLAYLTAVAHDPALLVLDEPTSGMDALSRARLWRELRGVADQGTGILVTTHYMEEAAQCDRLVFLTAGRVTTAGTAAEITSGQRSLAIESDGWQRLFTLLRAAGIPVLLHGRTLRVPGTDQATVTAALGDLARLDGGVRMTPTAATLEEVMLHDAAATSPTAPHA